MSIILENKFFVVRLKSNSESTLDDSNTNLIRAYWLSEEDELIFTSTVDSLREKTGYSRSDILNLVRSNSLCESKSHKCNQCNTALLFTSRSQASESYRELCDDYRCEFCTEKSNKEREVYLDEKLESRKQAQYLSPVSVDSLTTIDKIKLVILSNRELSNENNHYLSRDFGWNCFPSDDDYSDTIVRFEEIGALSVLYSSSNEILWKDFDSFGYDPFSINIAINWDNFIDGSKLTIDILIDLIKQEFKNDNNFRQVKEFVNQLELRECLRFFEGTLGLEVDDLERLEEEVLKRLEIYPLVGVYLSLKNTVYDVRLRRRKQLINLDKFLNKLDDNLNEYVFVKGDNYLNAYNYASRSYFVLFNVILNDEQYFKNGPVFEKYLDFGFTAGYKLQPREGSITYISRKLKPTNNYTEAMRYGSIEAAEEAAFKFVSSLRKEYFRSFELCQLVADNSGRQLMIWIPENQSNYREEMVD